ncbi:hypothetical protein FisN_4Hh527 [Fistulifera solaris]|uniref:tRNA-uridine aminocarboxypropyltransferase 1 n=1 Tax=Fistulifera solaris TaxID=1519565 RepID=A0A1Z5KIA4_FISSO|nr:hypothetical protein FisN_4Hh527 [Fistulifera solaris]|eukprot:GAX25989.1 hypothetical protein FisN_4Hh527 [Fistulifera solaris]
MSLGEAEQALVEFLQTCADFESAPPRVVCPLCRTSRAIYCPTCYQILIEESQRPEGIQSLRLPFHLDILLDDRRTSATGIPVGSIFGCSPHSRKSSDPVRIFDCEQELDDLPSSYGPNTYLLFPGETSQPVSYVAQHCTIDRVVVLDCKWQQTSIRMHPSVKDLPRIHLDSCPQHSYFWRWHNAGERRVSTVEAIYFCAWDVAASIGWNEDKKRNLVHLLWLFGIQREVIRRKYEEDGGVVLHEHMPFTEEGKQFQRDIRKRVDAHSKKEQ